jgi:hypothetical protein
MLLLSFRVKLIHFYNENIVMNSCVKWENINYNGFLKFLKGLQIVYLFNNVRKQLKRKYIFSFLQIWENYYNLYFIFYQLTE